MRKAFAVFGSWLLLTGLVLAQDSGRLEVQVMRGDTDAPLPGVKVRLTDRDGTSKTLELLTGEAGQVSFPSLEPGEYILDLRHPTMGGESTVIKIEPDRPTVYRSLLDPNEETFVVRDKRDLVNTTDPTQGSVTQRDREFIDRQVADRSLQGLLTTVPGLQRNSMGQTHVRGEHKSVAFSLDGVAVPIPMAATTSQPLDPDFLQGLTARTGSMNGSQGGQTGLVLDAQTPDSVEPFVEFQSRFGNVGQNENIMRAGGRDESGNFSFFVGAKTFATDLQFEPPHPDFQTLNNRGTGGSYLLRLTGRTPDDTFSAMASHQTGQFGLPQTPENFVAGVRQDQVDANTTALVSWKRRIDEDSDVLLSLAYLQSAQKVRHNGVFTPWNSFDPSLSPDLADAGLPADPERPGSPYLPFTDLSILEFQPSATYTHRFGNRHWITAGLNANFISSRQKVNLQDPGAGGGLPGGAPSFVADIGRNGHTAAAFWTHTLPVTDALTLNYGLRAETFDNGINVRTGQISPLLNVAYAFNDRNVLRASFNRSFQAPPLELDVTGQSFVLPQRVTAYELSYETQLSPVWTAKLAAVRKNYRDQVDIGLLIPNSNIPLFAPVNFAEAFYQGLELSINSHNPLGWNGFLTGTLSEARPLAPGLFATQVTDFSDHDQRLQVTGGVSYIWENGFSAALDGFYGSGFPQPAIPLYQNAGIFPYGLTSEREPRFLANLNCQYQPKPTGDGPDFGGGLQILNLFDSRPLLNFYSAFSGTRFVQRRRVLLNASIRF
jgi:outer membrane receptor protein involved in Fe transport